MKWNSGSTGDTSRKADYKKINVPLRKLLRTLGFKDTTIFYLVSSYIYIYIYQGAFKDFNIIKKKKRKKMFFFTLHYITQCLYKQK